MKFANFFRAAIRRDEPLTVQIFVFLTSRVKNMDKVKEKVKLSLYLTKHHAMKAYWGGGIAPRILDLGTRWR
jgi:hypothetical protein